jgi:hypothetical protein
MSSSTVFGQEYGYYRGMAGSSIKGAVLPPQAIPKNKKNKDWEKNCLDSLEREGIKQFIENLPMTDYYKMISGDMAYIDLVDEDTDILYSYIKDFKKEELNLPSYLKHWDLMYPVVSKIVGEWSMQYDKLRFDTTDPISTNEYLQERTNRLSKYSEALFQKQLNKLLLLNGIDIKEDFASEEEYNQYQQQIDAVINENFPEKVDSDLKKNFKTEAAQWAEKTWNRDYERFRMNILESMEARDILLVGKSARHYRIGHDYYYPEYWHPLEVFHSKEDSIKRMEDAEFVGRVKWYTVTDLINTYGDILSESERIAIYKSYFGVDYTESTNITNHEKSVPVLGDNMFERMQVPFKGYSDHLLALEFEEATGIPLSESTDLETGETRPSYSVPIYDRAIGYGAKLSQKLRNDIQIRTDTIQTTEVYWKGSKKIGILTYRTQSGALNVVEVDEDILRDVLNEYDIKNLKKISLKDYDKLPEEEKENTIIWIDTPIVYKGIKIKVSGIGLEDDIYKVEELGFQIKGEKGNIFDVKLPVTGYIGNSYCKIIRPYQIAFNFFMNQTQNYLEKEIGAFLVMDVNSIPSEYFGMEDGDDALLKVRNVAQTLGLFPTDYSRNTLNQNGGLSFNPMSYQSANFNEPINRNILLAEKYKWMAYETLGLTPTSMGSPSQYATTEGIQVGQKAYFAQTYNIDQVLMENKRSNTEVHITVAQYCQINNKDANYLYMASNNELEFLHSIKDEYFDLRQIDVRATYNPSKNMLFQQLRQTLINNNTMGNDALATIELFMSDDFMELRNAAKNARSYMEKMQREKMQHDEKMEAMRIKNENLIRKEELELENRKIDAGIEESKLTALGRAADKKADTTSFDVIQKAAEISLKQQDVENRNNAKLSELKNKLNETYNNFKIKADNILLEKDKLDLEREKLATMKYVADSKNRDSLINKN